MTGAVARSIELPPAELCVSFRRRSCQGFVDWIEACASLQLARPEGRTFATVNAELVMVHFADAQHAGCDIRAMCELHGFPRLADTYMSDCFELLRQTDLQRVLLLRSLYLPPLAIGANADLALARRAVELAKADALFVPWPPPGPNPERWMQFLSHVAVTPMQQDPVYLYHLARERWPLEVVDAPAAPCLRVVNAD